MVKEHDFAFHKGWPVSVHKITDGMAEVRTFSEPYKTVPVTELLPFNKANVKMMQDKYNGYISQANMRLHAIHDFLIYCPDGEPEE